MICGVLSPKLDLIFSVPFKHNNSKQSVDDLKFIENTTEEILQSAFEFTNLLNNKVTNIRSNL